MRPILVGRMQGGSADVLVRLGGSLRETPDFDFARGYRGGAGGSAGRYETFRIVLVHVRGLEEGGTGSH
jgi:hypothetical protein